MAMLPMLMIENSRQTNQAGAAIESFRNEMVKANKELNVQIIEANNKKKLK